MCLSILAIWCRVTPLGSPFPGPIVQGTLGFTSGVRWVSGGVWVGLRAFFGVSLGVSQLRWRGIGGGCLALAHLLKVRLRGFGRAEDEVAFHLIDLGAVPVSRPNKPAPGPVDTGDGAPLYPDPVLDKGGCSQEGSAPPPSSFFTPHRFFPTPLHPLPPPLLFWGGGGL